MSLAQPQTISLGGQTITVKELTVDDVQRWMTAIEAKAEAQASSEAQPHGEILAQLLVPDVPLHEIAKFTEADVTKLAPSEIRQLWEKCKEVNASFFDLRQRLAQIPNPETIPSPETLPESN